MPQIFLDTPPDMPIDVDLVRRFATRAEELGYHSLWVQERIIGNTAALEPIGLLNYLAALTDKIKLGTSMVIATTRNPVHLAKQFSSLDQMSRGRLIIGIGLGGRPEQYPLLDGPKEGRSRSRARHFRESLAVMKALWTQPEAYFSGQFWELTGQAMEPKPGQRPHPPVWFGGRHPQGLRRAARLADGWMGAGSTSTGQFKEQVAIVHEAQDAQRRDPGRVPNIQAGIHSSGQGQCPCRKTPAGLVWPPLQQREHGRERFHLGRRGNLRPGLGRGDAGRRPDAVVEPDVRPDGASRGAAGYR